MYICDKCGKQVDELAMYTQYENLDGQRVPTMEYEIDDCHCGGTYQEAKRCPICNELYYHEEVYECCERCFEENLTLENCLATGEIVPVRNTGMDFRTLTNIGERLTGEDSVIKSGGGIDHNFVLAMQRGENKKAAELVCEETGIKLECFTDQPGIQIYTGNFLDLEGGKGMVSYGKHYAVCLETQGFPNATEFSYFPSPVLKAGDRFYSKTSYKFSLV
jgi:hypothetical protein